jgi:hypothetical protein
MPDLFLAHCFEFVVCAWQIAPGGLQFYKSQHQIDRELPDEFGQDQIHQCG